MLTCHNCGRENLNVFAISAAWTREGGRPPPSQPPRRHLLPSTYTKGGLDQCSTSTRNPINMITVHFKLKQDQGAGEKVQSDMTYKGCENRRLVIEVCLSCWCRQVWIKALPNTPQYVYFIWSSRSVFFITQAGISTWLCFKEKGPKEKGSNL